MIIRFNKSKYNISYKYATIILNPHFKLVYLIFIYDDFHFTIFHLFQTDFQLTHLPQLNFINYYYRFFTNSYFEKNIIILLIFENNIFLSKVQPINNQMASYLIHQYFIEISHHFYLGEFLINCQMQFRRLINKNYYVPLTIFLFYLSN